MEEVDLPDCFGGDIGTHGGGDFFPRKRSRVQVLDDTEEQLEFIFVIPFNHLGGRWWVFVMKLVDEGCKVELKSVVVEECDDEGEWWMRELRKGR